MIYETCKEVADSILMGKNIDIADCDLNEIYIETESCPQCIGGMGYKIKRKKDLLQ
jgi:hypothetical protein